MVITYDKAGNKVTEKVGLESVALWSMPQNLLITTYNYYDNNLLKNVINGDGDRVEYEYDPNGNMTKETAYMDANHARITEYTYNYLNKVETAKSYVESKDIYGADTEKSTVVLTTEYTYDYNGNVKTITTPDGVVTEYEYDNLDRVITTTVDGLDEYGNKTKHVSFMTYDFNGNVLTVTDAEENLTQNIYDQKGLLIKTIDAENGITAYDYDNMGRLIAKVLPENYVEGAKLEEMSRAVYTYDSMNRIVLEQDIYFDESTKEFRTITSKAYQYDANGNVTKELDALGYASGTGTTVSEKIATGYGNISTYNDANMLITTLSPVSKDKGLAYDVKITYDAAGRKTSETNANNVVIKYYYDNAGRVTKTTVIDNTSVDKTEKTLSEATYDDLGNVLTMTDANGNKTTYTYNLLGLLRSQETPGDETIPAYVVQYQYNTMGKLAYQIDNMDRVVLWTYNHDGQVLTQTEQKLDGTESISIVNAYDKNGNVRFKTDANENTTEYVYDGLNRVTEIKITVNETERVTTKTYDKNGNVLSETDWLGNTYTYYYDALNRLVKKTNPYDIVIEKYEYNDNHAQIKAWDALEQATIFTYDKNNRLLSTEDPAGHKTSQTYDNVGNIETKTDGENNTTTFSYDGLNRLIKVTNAKGEETSYTYDLNGNKLTQTDGKLNTITYTYNAANLLIKKEDPEGTKVPEKTVVYTYYPNGKVATTTDRNGNVTTYTYDVHGNLINDTVTMERDGIVIMTDSITRTYDGNGNLLTITDSTGTTIRTYDELNRVETKTVPNVGTITYTYDVTEGLENGYYKEVSKDPIGNVTEKVYDKAGRLVQVIVGENVTTYTYYDNGNRKSVIYNDGATEEYTYYPNNQVKTLVNKKSDGTIMDSYSYTYDDAGNQLTKHEIINGLEKGTTTYTYDDLNRLVTVTEPNGRVTIYTYDAAGNRETETVIEGETRTEYTYTYNEQNRLTDITTKVNNVTISVTSYSYDNNGNQLVTTVKTYDGNDITSSKIILTNTYDLRNQLIRTMTENGSVITNSYNGEGLRVIKAVNGDKTYYLYEYMTVILEVDKNGNQLAHNVYGTNLLMRTVEGETYYYMYNGHGDVTALIDINGEIAATYYYDAFGNILDSTGDVNNNILYSGYQYDEETGLYYLNARMYDPKIARFL